MPLKIISYLGAERVRVFYTVLATFILKKSIFLVHSLVLDRFCIFHVFSRYYSFCIYDNNVADTRCSACKSVGTC